MYLAVGCPYFLDFYKSLAVFIRELQISLQKFRHIISIKINNLRQILSKSLPVMSRFLPASVQESTTRCPRFYRSCPGIYRYSKCTAFRRNTHPQSLFDHKLNKKNSFMRPKNVRKSAPKFRNWEQGRQNVQESTGREAARNAKKSSCVQIRLK